LRVHIRKRQDIAHPYPEAPGAKAQDTALRREPEEIKRQFDGAIVMGSLRVTL